MRAIKQSAQGGERAIGHTPPSKGVQLFSKSDLKVLPILLAFSIIWSLSILLMFVGIRALPATVLVTARATVAAVFMLVFFGRFSDLKFDRANIIYAGLAGLLGITIAPLFQVIRQFSYAPSASDVVFILSLAPIFMLLGSLIYFEKPTFEKIVGTCIALLGMVCVLANWEQPSSFAPFFKFFDNEIWMLGSCVSWAGFTLLGKKLVEKYKPATAAAVSVCVGTVPLIFLASADGSISKILELSSVNWLVIVLLGVFGTAIATVLWFKALAEIDISKAGSVMFLAPLLITLPTTVERNIGVWGITPMMTVPVIVGAALVVIGVAVVWKTPKAVKSQSSQLVGTSQPSRFHRD